MVGIFLYIADALTFLYLLTSLFTDGQRSIHDLLDGTHITRDETGGNLVAEKLASD
jgi:hypothetical protein